MPFSLSSNLTRPFGSFPGISADLDFTTAAFPVEQQLMSNWCWAACTIMVCRHYDTDSELTQQEFAAKMLENQLCSTVLHPFCNKTFEFDRALDDVRHLHNVIEDTLTAENVAEALNNWGPIGCAMEIPDIGGHAVLILNASGNNEASQFLTVADPSDASLLTMPYREFKNNYRGTGGYWVRSYYTKS